MLHGLSGTLWPIHLKPLPDELLSSWLIRFAHAHGYKTESMCRHLFGRDHQVWNRDIDKLAPEFTKDGMLRATGATIEQFSQTTFRPMEGYLSESINVNGLSPWIVPIGIFHRARQRPGLMFCASCLREDPIPYYRRGWRLAFSTVCTTHHTHLFERCPFCAAPIAPHRVDIKKSAFLSENALMRHCYNCQKNLHDAREDYARHELVEHQLLFEGALKKGYVNWSNNPGMYSHLFFEGMRELISGLISNAVLKRLKKSELDFHLSWERSRCKNFEELDIASRREVFGLTAKLTQNWPNAFVDFLHNGQVTYSDLKLGSKATAFWYEAVIKKEVYKPYIVLDLAYVNSIASATKSHFGRCNPLLMKKLSGRDVDPRYLASNKNHVTEEVAQALLISLDGEIAGAITEAERDILIRDKVMMALSRSCQLSIGGISNFDFSQLNIIDAKMEPLDFSHWPSTVSQARAWGEWFYFQIRPRFTPADNERHVFLSFRTGEPLKKSAISSRFHRATRAADICNEIDFSIWRNQCER